MDVHCLDMLGTEDSITRPSTMPSSARNAWARLRVFVTNDNLTWTSFTNSGTLDHRRSPKSKQLLPVCFFFATDMKQFLVALNPGFHRHQITIIDLPRHLQPNRGASWPYERILDFPLGAQSRRSELRNFEARVKQQGHYPLSLPTFAARRFFPIFPRFLPPSIGTKPRILPAKVRLFVFLA